MVDNGVIWTDKIQYAGGLVFVAFQYTPLDPSRLLQTNGKDVTVNFFIEIWPTYAMFWSWHIIFTSWLHGKLGRRMTMKPLSLICHAMVTWRIGTWVVGVFTEMTHQREGEMVS